MGKNWSRIALIILGVYWASYATVASLVEPIGWFGGDGFLKRIGVWGNVGLLTIPLVLVIGWFTYQRVTTHPAGVRYISSGLEREKGFFQNIDSPARYKITIVGIGMTNVSRYGLRALKEWAAKVPIDLLMIDPDFLDRNAVFTKALEDFLQMENFDIAARTAFETLERTCIENNGRSGTKRMRLRVFSTIPTASITMIDPDNDSGRMIIEFFLYHSGERRPRIEAVPTGQRNGIFEITKDRYDGLWHKSRVVVE